MVYLCVFSFQSLNNNLIYSVPVDLFSLQTQALIPILNIHDLSTDQNKSHCDFFNREQNLLKNF